MALTRKQHRELAEKFDTYERTRMDYDGAASLPNYPTQMTQDKLKAYQAARAAYLAYVETLKP